MNKRKHFKHLRQCISMILIIALLVTLLPAESMAGSLGMEAAEELSADTNQVSSEQETEESVKGLEDIDMELEVSDMPEELIEALEIDVNEIKALDDVDSADLYSVTTIDEDDTRTLHIFDTPIKYYDTENNEIKFIDNTLKKSDRKALKNGTYAYENAANSIKVFLPQTSNDSVKIEDGDGYSLEFTAISDNTANAKLKKFKFNGEEQNVAEYKNAFGTGYDLQYIPQNDGVKENILIRKNSGKYTFAFTLKAQGLVPEQMEGKTVNFVKEGTNIITDTETEDSDLEETETEVIETEVVSTENTEAPSTETEVAGTESVGIESISAESLDTEEVGTESVEIEDTEKVVLETESPKTEAISTEHMETETIATEMPETEVAEAEESDAAESKTSKYKDIVKPNRVEGDNTDETEEIPPESNIVFTLGELFIRDSYIGESDGEAHCSFENHYQIEDMGDYCYRVTYVLDEEFLNQESTQYPVLVDPSVKTITTILDAAVYKSQPTKNFGSSALIQIGDAGGTYGLGYGFFKTNIIGNYKYINPNKITSAVLRVYENSGTTYTSTFKAYDCDETWTSGSIKWDNMPGKYGSALSTVSISSSGAYEFAITSVVKDWLRDELYEGGFEQGYGVMIVPSSSTTQRKDFCSAEYGGTASRCPSIKITYEEDTSIADGTYFIMNYGSDLYLDANTTNDNVRQYNVTNTDKQQWIVTHRGDGYYTIANKYYGSSGYLDVEASDASPVNADIFPGISDPRNRFKIVKNNDGSGTYRIVSKALNDLKSLCISGGSLNSGANAVYGTYNADLKYQWKFKAASTQYTMPDLKVNSITPPAMNGPFPGAYTFTANIYNTYSKVAATTTKFELLDNKNAVLQTVNVSTPALDGNASSNVSAALTIPAAGNYTVRVTADAAGKITEYNETNNVSTKSVVAKVEVTITPSGTTTVDVNTTKQLTATVEPTTLVDRNVTWTTSNAAIATVSTTGVVTGKSAGTATITAISNVDKSVKATCAVTVKVPTVSMAAYNTASLSLDSTLQLSATVTGIANTEVTWSSSNTSIATVNSTGLVSAKLTGTVTITATSKQDSTKSATCTITVIGAEEKRFYGIAGGYAPTGNYSQTFTDLTVPSVLGELSLSRTYNSLEAASDTMVGKGFRFNYDMRVLTGTTKPYVIMPDGSWWCFTKNTDGTYTANDCRGTLKWNASASEYTLETLAQVRYGFASNGYLKYIEDFKGNRITVERDATNKITTMKDAIMSVSFTYDGIHLAAIQANGSDRSVQYEYTDSTKTYLKTVTDTGGFKTSYEYTSGLLSKITEGTLVKAVITYDTTSANAGRVKSITDDQGVESNYQYLSRPSMQTPGTVKIVDNNSDTMMYYQTTLDVTKVTVAPKGQTKVSALTETEVNEFHEVTLTKDLLGNITTYKYDAKGNLTRVDYPDNSNEQYTYDTNNNKTSDTDKSGLKTTYTYDSYCNLTKVTRPLNGVNQDVNKYEYYTDNTYPIRSLLKKEIGSLGDANNCIEYTYSFAPTAISPNPVKTVTTIKRIGGVNKSTKVEYDKVGNVIKETTPTGIVTVNTYNPTTGLLTSTEILDNSQRQQTTTYLYEGQDLKQTTDIFYDGSPSGTTAYEYDKSTGNLIKETAPDGTVTVYHYDAQNSVETEKALSNQNQLLETTTTTYDELDRDITEKTTIENATTEIATTEIAKTEYTYDTARKVNIVTETDEYGGVTVTETGWDGRLISQKKPNGLVQINTYDVAGRIQRETYQNSSGTVVSWTEYTYDGWGRVTKKVSSFQIGGEAEVRYSYDVAGNVQTTLTKVDAGKYSKTENVYDTWGNKIRTTSYAGFFDANGAALDAEPVVHTQTLYDWDGQVLLECKGQTAILATTALQNLPADGTYSVIKYQYDNFRRKTLKTDALGKTERYQYNHVGLLAKTTDRNGIVHEIKYDQAGRATEEKSGDIKKTYVYDSGGNLSSVTDGTTTVEYQYDGSGNVILEKSGNVAKNFSEEIKKEKRADGAEIVVGRDVTESITVGGTVKQQVRKIYNTSGQLTAVYDLLYSVTIPKAKYSYNLLGQLVTTDNANGTTEVNEYNSNGLVTKTVNKKGTAILSQYEYAYYYDGSQKTKNDGTGTTTYTYDGNGQLLKSVTTEPDNTTMLNATTVTGTVGVNIATANQVRYYRFTANKTGEYVISSTNCTKGDPYGYLYTADGTQLASNDDGAGSSNFKIVYTLNAGVTYIIGAKMYATSTGSYNLSVLQNFGANDLDQTIFANARPIVAGETASVSITAATQIKYYKFTPDRTGSYTITSSKSSATPYCYLYTAEGTLLATGNDVGSSQNLKLEYTMNAGTSYIIGAKIYAYSTGSYMMTIMPPSSNPVTQEYAYDANGNRTSMKETKDKISTETVYTYDKNDCLLTEKNGIQPTITYSYDNNGNMTGKSDGTVQNFDALNRMVRYQKSMYEFTDYTYYPDDMRKSKKVGGAKLTEHVWLGDEIALDLNGTVVTSSYIHGNKLISSTYGWYLYNAHGDVVCLTNDNGTIARNYEYDPFGVQLFQSAFYDNNPYRYSGEYYDAESGYTYLRARYYDPAIGRFISEDPALDGLNWYVYCGNDPISMIDPSGLACYYFYGSDQEKHAKKNISLIKKKHAVISKKITSTADFTKQWIEMGKYIDRGKSVQGKVDIVVINMHGSPKSVTNVNLNSLTFKPIDTLILLSCNAGHQDYQFTNPAVQLFRKGVRQLVACDGTHHRGPISSVQVKDDKKWKSYATDKKRKSQGFVKYYSVPRIPWIKVDSIGKKFSSVPKLLNKVGKW